MKISILLETNSSGGGSFTHSVNTCLDLKRFCGIKNEIIVYTQFKKSFETLKDLKIPVKLFSHSFLDKLLLKFSIFKIFRFLTDLINIKISIEKTIIENKSDLIFFPVLSNTVFCLKKMRFISTLLDLEHFKHSTFPEITEKDFNYRENLYFYSLKRSELIITSCESIKKNLCRHYKINKEKVHIIPYTPSNLFIKKKISKKF